MLVSKRKHESIVSMKDADIKILENKLEGVKELLKTRDLELYEANQEANKLSNEVETLKLRNEDKDIAINYLEDEKKQLIKDIERVNDTNLKLRDDNIELQRQIDSYKQRLEKIDSLKKQYKWYLSKSIEISVVTKRIDYKDGRKFVNKEGIEGVVDAYNILSMM